MSIPFQKNDRFYLDIQSFSDKGFGLGVYRGAVVLVPFTCPGDSIYVHITKVSFPYSFGKCVEMVRARRANRVHSVNSEKAPATAGLLGSYLASFPVSGCFD